MVKIKSKPRSHQPIRKKKRNQDELEPKQIKVPPLPVADENPLVDEQQVARVEILMTKGVRDKRQLMTLLEVEDHRKMERYIKRVHARWEMYGTQADFSRHRGEGLVRLDLIESELWSKLQNSGDDRMAMVALRSLLEVQSQRMSLLGLTPRIVEQLTTQGGEGSLMLTRRLTDHNMMAKVAQRMMDLMRARLPQPVTIEDVASTSSE